MLQWFCTEPKEGDVREFRARGATEVEASAGTRASFVGAC